MSIKQTVQVFDLLLQGSFSRMELARRADISPKFVGRVLQEMKAQKLIYVIEYANQTDGRNRVKVFTLGNGVDAAPKKSRTQEERQRRSALRKAALRMQAEIKTTFVGNKGLWQ
jgi:DNA-binding HxlR family transcriptional regulator